ncbi:ribosome recycling factor [Thiospirochaeta perfilievii]|uniref:Ribosome-recycling factor n=1 Tax=Thiospirochaeta perfilievii TaxID=252967 RepID=A0A5C1QGD4_9SPIO|nr:ribosome recycling factor [Thiospirochaeta perfilievii]QEN06129.1 ribosome recycling factor [Thiospirochaeta perfilievii]
MDTIKQSAENKMKKSISALKNEFNSIRTGRASASIFDKIRVEYYGTPTPLNQLATISIPEARLIVIQPFDKNSLNEIERAIFASDLGLTPGNDGKVIRINIPPLTEQRRKELSKQAKNIGENSKIAIRNIRRDSNDLIKKGDFSEDEVKSGQTEIQELTDKYIKEVDIVFKEKEKEIMEV